MAAVYCLDRWKTFTDYFRFLHDISVQNAYITKEQDFFYLLWTSGMLCVSSSRGSM